MWLSDLKAGDSGGSGFLENPPDLLIGVLRNHVCYLWFMFTCMLQMMFSFKRVVFEKLQKNHGIPFCRFQRWSPCFCVDVSWCSVAESFLCVPLIKQPPQNLVFLELSLLTRQPHPFFWVNAAPWVAREMSWLDPEAPAMMKPVVGWNHHVLAKKENIDYIYPLVN